MPEKKKVPAKDTYCATLYISLHKIKFSPQNYIEPRYIREIE